MNFEENDRPITLIVDASGVTNYQAADSCVAKNYETIQGAQLSNSFIILMALCDVKEPLNTTQISELIALHTKGQIYKISIYSRLLFLGKFF